MPKIDPIKYLLAIDRLLGNGMVVDPRSCKEIFHFYYDDKGYLIGWDAKSFCTRFENNDFLNSHEYVTANNSDYVIDEVSFHYQPPESSERKLFRVDNCHNRPMHFHHYCNPKDHCDPALLGYDLEGFCYLFALRFSLKYVASGDYPFDKTSVKEYCKLIDCGG